MTMTSKALREHGVSVEDDCYITISLACSSGEIRADRQDIQCTKKLWHDLAMQRANMR